MRKWNEARTVTVPRPINGDEKIWWYYALTMTCNRHVAEYMDDDEVSEALNKMAARLELPYGFDKLF